MVWEPSVLRGGGLVAQVIGGLSWPPICPTKRQGGKEGISLAFT